MMAVALLAAASLTLGSLALARVPLDDFARVERAALTLIAGVGLAALLAGLAAITGHLARVPLWLVPLALAAPVVALRDRRLTRRGPVGAVGWSRAIPVMVLIAAALACMGALAPVTDDDALTYVLPVARRIAATGRVAFWPDQAKSALPLSHDVLLATIMQLGGDRFGALSAFEGLLALGALSALARRVCAQSAHVPVAVALAAASPVVAFQFASAKEDLLLTAAVVAAATFMVSARRDAEYAAAGLFAGIAAGTKYPGLVAAVAITAWACIGSRGHRTRATALTAAAAAAAGGLWYGLNAWRFGNPVAPLLPRIGHAPFDAAAVAAWLDSFGRPRGVLEFFATPVRLFASPSLFGGRMNLQNPAMLAGAGVVLSVAARRRHLGLACLALAWYSVWYAGLQNARLLLPAFFLLAPAAADFLVPLVAGRPVRRTAAAGALGLALTLPAGVGLVRVARYLRDPTTYLDRETQHHADIRWMNAHLDPSRNRVASIHKGFAYLDVPALLLDPTYETVITPADMADARQLVAACRREGVTHLFAAPDSFAEARDRLRVVYTNPASRLGGVRFFREPPTEATALFEIVH